MEWFEDGGEWEGLKILGMVETQTEIKGEIRKETRYYLSSLPLGVESLAKAVRSHWGWKTNATGCWT